MEYDIELYSSLRGGSRNLRSAPDSIFTSAHRRQSSSEPGLRCQSCSGDSHLYNNGNNDDDRYDGHSNDFDEDFLDDVSQ